MPLLKSLLDLIDVDWLYRDRARQGHGSASLGGMQACANGSARGGIAASPSQGAAACARLIEQADRLRDAGRYAEAAEVYGAVIEAVPFLTHIRVQHGNMLKEIGRLDQAEAAYRAALGQLPEVADIHLQLGHVLKLQGRRAAAAECYSRAAMLVPSAAAEPRQELFNLGDRPTQERLFEAQLRLGSVEALMTLSRQVADLQSVVERLSRALPNPQSQAAVPSGCYDAFRAFFKIPAPPKPATEPTFGIILLSDRETFETLRDLILAIRRQDYCHWSLHVIGEDAAGQRTVGHAAAGSGRIVWEQRQPGESLAAAEHRVAQSIRSDWLVLLAQGAVLHSAALEWFAAVAERYNADAYIPDEEIAGSADGQTELTPELRQVIDYDMLLEANVLGETVVVRSSAYPQACSIEVTDSIATARSVLLLNLARSGRVGHIPCILVRREIETDFSRQSSQSAHQRAVRIHLEREGLSERLAVEPTKPNAAEGVLVRWHSEEPKRTIAVIIPTRDNGADLDRAVRSLIATAAAPNALEIIIVDNGSTDPGSCEVISRLVQETGALVLIVDEPFNWSRLNNQAVQQTAAPLLLFINDDVTMLSEGWDDILRGHLGRAEIGALGARLLYPDDSVQHAGILFGWPGSLTIHDGLYERSSAPGPLRRWHLTHAVSAVTGAFMATRRQVFVEHGGFDEVNLSVGYSDIDYALKLRRSGLRILWTPHVTLHHLESKTRGLDHLDLEKRARNNVEYSIMSRRWGAALEAEPTMNPLWHRATLPFRLLLPSSRARLWDHIGRCAAPNPWLPATGPGGDAVGPA